jgi:hypothetical protein
MRRTSNLILNLKAQLQAEKLACHSEGRFEYVQNFTQQKTRNGPKNLSLS